MPNPVWYVPVLHFWQEVIAVLGAYVPVPQRAHARPELAVATNAPVIQKQLFREVALEREKVLLGQVEGVV